MIFELQSEFPVLLIQLLMSLSPEKSIVRECPQCNNYTNMIRKDGRSDISYFTHSLTVTFYLHIFFV